MDTVLHAAATWLHLLATAILIGQYVLLSFVYVPLFTRQLKGATLGEMLEALFDKARPFVLGSVLVFIITGIYLMLVDSSYLGFGDFGNTWSVMMLVKHILVLALFVLGAYVERTLVVKLAGALKAGQESSALTGQFRTAMNAMMLGSIVILLLTALAEAV
ncbi:MAG: CopD family protein [Anaerolineae bacterium]|nr:CopD family protein [Anaerolineae bacterium]